MKCEEKKRFSTKARAKQAAGQAKRIRGLDLFVYKCPTCKFWHLTHQPQFLVTKKEVA